MAPEIAVKLDDVSKTFRAGWTRKHYGVENLDLEIQGGEAVALVGTNGAGKTTLLRLVVGITSPTSGTVEVFGRPPGTARALRRVGYLPQDFGVPAFQSVRSALASSAGLSGLHGAAVRRLIAELLEEVGLDHDADRRISTLSKGMLRRLGVAQALLGEPDLLILDEPLNGLDPSGRQAVAALIRERVEHGTTLVMSSHLIHDLERICTRVVVMASGRLQLDEPITHLMAQATPGTGLEEVLVEAVLGHGGRGR